MMLVAMDFLRVSVSPWFKILIVEAHAKPHPALPPHSLCCMQTACLV